MSQDHVCDNRRILIIDDNADIHADYRRVLTDHRSTDSLAASEAVLFGKTEPAHNPAHEFELHHASQGEFGYELLRRELQNGRPFALAFVDMRMPPGWED